LYIASIVPIALVVYSKYCTYSISCI